MSQTNEAPVLVLCRDLLFSSKITATAKALGVGFLVVRDPKKLDEAPQESKRLLVDLMQQGFLEAAAGWKQRTGGHVVGFAGHTEIERIESANAAGLDLVLSRGAFTAQLETILTSPSPSGTGDQ